MSQYTADTVISDVLRADPSRATVFEAFGLGCAGCLAAGMETISAVAGMHDVSVDTLLQALNGSNDIEDSEADV